MSPSHIERSTHQLSYCAMCEDDAVKYNHCAWCGLTFTTLDKLSDHLDESNCFENMRKALG